MHIGKREGFLFPSRTSCRIVTWVSLSYKYQTRNNSKSEENTASTTRSRLTGLLAVHGHNLDSIRLELQRGIHLQRSFLDNKGPNVVAETIRVKMALRERQAVGQLRSTHDRATWRLRTLKVMRVLTFSPRTSAMMASKCSSILMATCGSMRRSAMKVSRASTRAEPMLDDSQPGGRVVSSDDMPAPAIELVVMGRIVDHFW
jgi:hypothetical protein